MSVQVGQKVIVNATGGFVNCPGVVTQMRGDYGAIVRTTPVTGPEGHFIFRLVELTPVEEAKETHYLYRYESSSSSSYVDLQVFIITRATPEGWWCLPAWVYQMGHDEWERLERKWVSNSARKRYCYPTKKEAWESYRIRKYWRVKHLTRQLEKAHEDCNLAHEQGVEPPECGIPSRKKPVTLMSISFDKP